MKQKSPIIFTLLFALIILLSYVSAFGINFGDYNIKSLGSAVKQGLDLKGGVYIIEEIQDKNVTSDMVDRAIQQIKQRVDKLGVVDPTIVREGSNKIRIEIPGMKDQNEALEYIGKTGKLTFRAPDNKTELLTGSDVSKAYVSFYNNQPVVTLELNSNGTKKFADATQKYLGQKIGIYLDEDQFCDPTVEVQITDGKAIIENMKSTDEAKKVASLIQSGALPVTLKATNVRTVGPSLGTNSLSRSLLAGVIGIALVMIFMLVYYRLPGLIADMALLVYILILLVIYVLFHVTLTLSGISGFLLTIGMAVDANVLIFERLKEELKAGKTLHAALNAGFDRAWTAIIDSNMTTVIAGIVLALLGSGTVKGFAVTLIIGVLASMFTAITVTRFLLNLVMDMKVFNNPRLWVPGRRQENA